MLGSFGETLGLPVRFCCSLPRPLTERYSGMSKYVEVINEPLPDGGSIPPTSTRLRSKQSENEACHGVFRFIGRSRASSLNKFTDYALACRAFQCRNGFGETGYGGPCPPRGSQHHYCFTLYALDRTLELTAGASRAQVVNAMQGHILDMARLTGTFQR